MKNAGVGRLLEHFHQRMLARLPEIDEHALAAHRRAARASQSRSGRAAGRAAPASDQPKSRSVAPVRSAISGSPMPSDRTAKPAILPPDQRLPLIERKLVDFGRSPCDPAELRRPALTASEASTARCRPARPDRRAPRAPARRGLQATSGSRGERPSRESSAALADRGNRLREPAPGERSLEQRRSATTQTLATRTAIATKRQGRGGGRDGHVSVLAARECGPRRRRIPGPNRPSKSPPARPKRAASRRASRAAWLIAAC